MTGWPEDPAPEQVVELLVQLATFGVPTPDSARLLDVGTDAFVRFFEDEILDGMLPHAGATCRLFEGPYGSGKTHLLQLLELSARDRGMAVLRAELSAALGLEDARNLTQHILQSIELKTPQGTQRSLPRILEHVGRVSSAGPGELQEGANLPHPGFTTAMGLTLRPSGLSDEARDLLARFLQGERVGAMALRKVGVHGVGHPLSARNAELVLRTVLEALPRLGIRGTILLFDETEDTFVFKRASPPRRVVQAANLLRHVVDGCANGSLRSAVAVFAVLPGFLESCALAYPALGQRLQPIGRGAAMPGWRSPVLPVEYVNTVRGAPAFLEELVRRLEHLVKLGGGSGGEALQAKLRNAGKAALQREAGSGYRRALIKPVATAALSRCPVG